ncbi:ParB/RepB/Spo0J family partition protein [Rhodococcus koreensis]
MKTRIEKLRLKELRAQNINARYMTSTEFQTLVANLRKDGVLTSVPLVRTEDDGGYRILSGHHRVKAAIEADIEHGECMIIDEPMTRQQEVALVLSHNAISGEDDPATLRKLYDELDDPDWRWYSGLDDRTLDLMDQVSTEGLSEANLEFSTVSLVFLPHEKEIAQEAFGTAAKQTAALEYWVAALSQYEPTLAALESVHSAYRVGNVATAFGLILGVFERHLEELADGWVDKDGKPTRKGSAPMESVFGSRMVPVDKAAKIRKAMKAAVKAGDLEADDPWAFIELLADTYMLSVRMDTELKGK